MCCYGKREYIPFALLKSGIPEGTEIPAPEKTTRCLLLEIISFNLAYLSINLLSTKTKLMAISIDFFYQITCDLLKICGFCLKKQ